MKNQQKRNKNKVKKNQNEWKGVILTANGKHKELK